MPRWLRMAIFYLLVLLAIALVVPASASISVFWPPYRFDLSVLAAMVILGLIFLLLRLLWLCLRAFWRCLRRFFSRKTSAV